MNILKNSNLWNFYGKPSSWIVITTNVMVRKNGEAILGAGIALQAAERFRNLPAIYGAFLKNSQDKTAPFFYSPQNLILFPTKIDWREPSKISLIVENCKRLTDRILEVELSYGKQNVYLPPLGCGLGRLNWEDVEAAISPILGNSFNVVFKE